MKRLSVFLIAILFCPAFLVAQEKDTFDFIDNDPAGCCFDLMVTNTHQPASPLNRIRLTVITPGVTIRSGAQGPWALEREDPDVTEFGAGGEDLAPDDFMEGFTFCFDRIPGVGQNFLLVWEAEWQGNVVSRDTVELLCEPLQSFCDSIRFTPVSVPSRPIGSCAYDITIMNRRTPASALDGLSLQPFSAGVEFVGAASGPWPVTQQTAGMLTFAAQGDSLDAGMNLPGFRVFLKRTDGKEGPVTLLWRTKDGNVIRCEGIVTEYCVPETEALRDSLRHRDLGDCNHVFGFRNSHTPASDLDGFRVAMLTPGATIDSSFTAPGWSFSSSSAMAAQFKKDGAPLAHDDSASGFRFRFLPPPGGTFRVVFSTLIGSSRVTNDTLTFHCDPQVDERCDSLLLDADEQNCRYDFGFVNLHEPESSINEFRLRLLTPGVTLTSLSTPFEWFTADSSDTEILFRTSTAIVPSSARVQGFVVDMLQQVPGTTIRFEWCTGWNDSVFCCVTDSVRCEPPDARDDSVAVTVEGAYCRYAFQLVNAHVPTSALDAFSVRLDDEATLILQAGAPAGWHVDSLSDRTVHFSVDTASLGSGAEAGPFVLDLLPSWTDTRIPFTWCSWDGGIQVSCDTGSASCDPMIVRPDAVTASSDAERPCCFEFQLANDHLPGSALNGFNLDILTQNVTYFASTVEDADGWTHTGTDASIVWRNGTGSVDTGDTLRGLKVCFDNNAVGNGDFRVRWQSVANGLVLSNDTLTIKCDRTLSVDIRSPLLPDGYALYQNYPNPFNPTTTIAFDLPVPGEVTLTLYDATGRLVMDLGSGHYMAGRYRIRLDASSLASGTYYYQLRTAAFQRSRALLLLR